MSDANANARCKRALRSVHKNLFSESDCDENSQADHLGLGERAEGR